MDYSGKIIRRTPVTPSQTSASGVWSLDEALQAQKNDSWPIANVPDPISRSLRFRASASANLTRTPTTTGSQTTATYSFWVKRGSLGAYRPIHTTKISSSGANATVLGFNSSDQLQVTFASTADVNYGNFSTAVYRDPSAWYHIVVAVDTTQTNSADRLKAYVNGVLVSSYSTSNVPPQGATLRLSNSSFPMNIAVDPRDGAYYDGYITESYFIDGQALTPSSFGSTNAVTGVWQPIPYTGTYGTNGFYLTFSNITSTAALGNDSSGNGNNFTVNNISLTSGSTYDSMLDTPTQWIGYTTGNVNGVTRGNYCVMNPVANFTGTLSNGNLTLVTTVPGNDRFCQATFKLPRTGKWYWENTISISTSADARNRQVIANAEPNSTSFGSIYAYINCHSTAITTSATLNSNMNTAMNAGGGGVLAFAYDADAGSLWLLKDGNINTGSTANVTNLSNANGDLAYLITEGSGTVSGTNNLNFGQRPFAYTPPSGFRSLCTTNLPNPTILQGDDYFNIALYSGNSTARTISGLGFQPDFNWTKPRNAVGAHVLTDAVRGVTNFLETNSAGVEQTGTTGIQSWNSDGYALGTGNDWNITGETFVSWNWRASNASGVTNTAGSITSTVSANTTAGFSIVTYTGNSTSNATVGHGLGVAPAMMIVKNRSSSNFWIVQHQSLTGITWNLYLNDTSSQQNDGQFQGKSSTTVTLRADGSVNTSGNNYVMYCFAAVAGYSAFGSYTGNASTDGPFIYTGFRPKYVLIKRTDSADDWIVMDSSRNTFNVANSSLFPNGSFSETTDSNRQEDFLSNGFKIRSSGVWLNANGATYIYAAFAESPFKNALAR